MCSTVGKYKKEKNNPQLKRNNPRNYSVVEAKKVLELKVRIKIIIGTINDFTFYESNGSHK
jgi:hypothetical protein